MIRRPTVLSLLKARLAAFRDDERANMSMETVIIFPMLVWVYLAMYVFFDAFRTQSLSDKAAYTIADMVSREDVFVNNTYLDTLYSVHGALSNSNHPTQMRVSMVRYNQNNDRYFRIWSRNRGGMGNLNNPMLRRSEYRERLPVVPHQDKFVLVETRTIYEPPFNLGWFGRVIVPGLDAHRFETFTITRPRGLNTQVCFQKNNGDMLC